MKDENLFVRRKAAEALGKITIVGTIEPLSAALKVKNLEVIAEAYIFLFKEVNQEQRFSLSRL
jgi:HEAT repeat protein